MTDHNNPAPEQEQTGVSGDPQSSGTGNGSHVPKERFDKVYGERRDFKQRLEQAEAELARLRGDSPQSNDETPSDPPSPAPAPAADVESAVRRAMESILSDTLAPTLQAQKDREIAAALGINRPPTEQEREAVTAVEDQHPSMSTEEAVLLAQAKSPDVFGGNGKRQGASYQQPVSRAPGSHRQPPPAEEKESVLDLPADAPRAQREKAFLSTLSDRVKNIRNKQG